MDYFMPLPKPYFVASESELATKRSKVAEADEAAVKEADPITKIGKQQHAEALRHELENDERQALLDTIRRAPVQPQRPTANVATEVQYLAPVPYFEVAPVVGNAAAPVEWPKDFVARTALLDAAVAEVRRLKLLEPLG